MKNGRWTAALPALLLASCAAIGGPRRLTGAGEASAARGSVQFLTVERGVTSIDLSVRNLPDPELLNPPGYVYIAWVRAGREAPARNVGWLDRGPGRTLALRALTDYDVAELFVTAEAAGDAERPTGPRLLWTRRN